MIWYIQQPPWTGLALYQTRTVLYTQFSDIVRARSVLAITGNKPLYTVIKQALKSGLRGLRVHTMCVRPIFDNFNYSKCHRETLLFLLFCFVLCTSPWRQQASYCSTSTVLYDAAMFVNLFNFVSTATVRGKRLLPRYVMHTADYDA